MLMQQQRIKCDEKRPACERCLRSGWVCPGYSQASADAVCTATARSLVTTSSALNITHYSLPFKVPGSQEERRALHYFANFAAADVSGYLPSDFWSRTILQRCQHDVPVRHAAAALGRAHMEYINAADTTDFNVSEETAASYGKAIKSVRNYLGRNGDHDKSMVLICSAIFYCFELMRSERRGALQHLESGTKILRSWQVQSGSSSNTAAESREELLATFIKMELQAAYYDDARQPTLPNPDEEDVDIDSAPFESLNEAQESLNLLMHAFSAYLVQNTALKLLDRRVIPSQVSSKRSRLIHQYECWARRLCMLRENSIQSTANASVDGARYRTVLAVFKLHWQTTRLLLLHSLDDDVKDAAPTFDDVAEEHLTLAKAVIDTPIQSDRQSGLSPDNPSAGERSFSLHLGIITPMMLLAVKTEHANIRQRAVELLRAAKGRREGFHDAEITANLITDLEANAVGGPYDRPGSSGPPPAALEWYVGPAMKVECWQDDAERLDGWERLWTAVA
jgi:hypothetical protein